MKLGPPAFYVLRGFLLKTTREHVERHLENNHQRLSNVLCALPLEYACGGAKEEEKGGCGGGQWLSLNKRIGQVHSLRPMCHEAFVGKSER